MHFVRAGSGAPPLVFVHGFACSSEDWHFQLDELRKNAEVVACDLRGHGSTPGRPSECSIEHYGGDVAALLANLDFSKSVLIGHSMGCRVVLEANRLAPERVAGLVLIDGSRQGVGEPDAAEAAARAAIDTTGYLRFAETLFRGMFFQKTKQSEDIVERALRLPAEIGTALWPRVVRWDAAELDAALAAVRAPLMAIQSTAMSAERKRLPLKAGETSPWLDLVRARVPDCRIEVISGVGHFAQLEAADRVNRLIAEAGR